MGTRHEVLRTQKMCLNILGAEDQTLVAIKMYE